MYSDMTIINLEMAAEANLQPPGWQIGSAAVTFC